MNKRWHRSWTTIGIGFLLSGVFLWLALRQVDAKQFSLALTSADLKFVLASAAALVTGLILRALRWLMVAGAQLPAYSNFLRSNLAGLLANMLLPARTGEVVRILTLAKFLKSKLAGPVASALIDRMIDVVVLLGSSLIVYYFLPIRELLDKWLIGLVSVCLIALAGLIVITKSRGAWQSLFMRFIERKSYRWKLKPIVFLKELRSEIKSLLRGRSGTSLVIVAMSILITDYFAILAMISAFHLSLPYIAALLLWVFLAAGSALPSAPGYIGTYQAAAVWALSFYAVPASSAVAIAVVLQCTTLAVAFLMAVMSYQGHKTAFWKWDKELSDENKT
jgi:uncharacterized protein (TIRG00374 family)